MDDIRKKIEKTYSQEIIISSPPTFEDKIKLISIVLISVSIEKELQILLDEYHKLK